MAAERDTLLQPNNKGTFHQLLATRSSQSDEKDACNGIVRLQRTSDLLTPRKSKLGQMLVTSGVLAGPPRLVDDVLELQTARLSEWDYLKGGWLEAEVARRIAAADPDDWCSGVAVERGPGMNNELDAMVTTGNRTLLVEVKTANLRREKSDEHGFRSTAAQDSRVGAHGQGRPYVRRQEAS